MPERNRNFTQTIVGICQDAKYIVQYSKESVERAREAMRENEEVIRVVVSPMTPDTYNVKVYEFYPVKQGLCTVPEGMVCKDPSKYESKRERNDDHNGRRKPGDSFCQGHNTKIIDCPVQIQTWNHNDDRRNRQGNTRITVPFFDKGR